MSCRDQQRKDFLGFLWFFLTFTYLDSLEEQRRKCDVSTEPCAFQKWLAVIHPLRSCLLTAHIQCFPTMSTSSGFLHSVTAHHILQNASHFSSPFWKHYHIINTTRFLFFLSCIWLKVKVCEMCSLWLFQVFQGLGSFLCPWCGKNPCSVFSAIVWLSCAVTLTTVSFRTWTQLETKLELDMASIGTNA